MQRRSVPWPREAGNFAIQQVAKPVVFIISRSHYLTLPCHPSCGARCPTTIDTRTSSSLVFDPSDYESRFAAPCRLDEALSSDRHQGWYADTGITFANLPLAGQISPDGRCDCSSNDVLVIAAQWCVSEHSGDSYWDYEIACSACGKFIQRSFCEND